MNQQIAVEDELLVPVVPANARLIETWPPFPFANLSHYEPDGWEKTETKWVVGQAALTVQKFKQAIQHHNRRHPEHGYAITDVRERQVVVTAFCSSRETK